MKKIQTAIKKAPIQKVTSDRYIRNEDIAEFVKREAKGKCQLCKQTAPFIDKNNTPYLESHHIEWLSKGGQDTIDNTVALCPNCHRKMHVLNIEEDKKALKNIAKNNLI